jgi:hypothetical protein
VCYVKNGSLVLWEFIWLRAFQDQETGRYQNGLTETDGDAEHAVNLHKTQFLESSP